MEQLRREALRAEGEEQRFFLERATDGEVTVDMNRAALSPQQMVNLDRLAHFGAQVNFSINDGTHHMPRERQLNLIYQGNYYPLHVNGEIQRMTVTQPLAHPPSDSAPFVYERETPQGRITSTIRKDEKSGVFYRELSLEPREPMRGKETIRMTGLTPQERAIRGGI